VLGADAEATVTRARRHHIECRLSGLLQAHRYAEQPSSVVTSRKKH
jgi:hypothetical protein